MQHEHERYHDVDWITLISNEISLVNRNKINILIDFYNHNNKNITKQRDLNDELFEQIEYLHFVLENIIRDVDNIEETIIQNSTRLIQLIEIINNNYDILSNRINGKFNRIYYKLEFLEYRIKQNKIIIEENQQTINENRERIKQNQITIQNNNTLIHNNKTEIEYLKIKIKQLEEKIKQSCKTKPNNNNNYKPKPKPKQKYDEEYFNNDCENKFGPVTRDEFRMRRRRL